MFFFHIFFFPVWWFPGTILSEVDYKKSYLITKYIIRNDVEHVGHLLTET